MLLFQSMRPAARPVHGRKFGREMVTIGTTDRFNYRIFGRVYIQLVHQEEFFVSNQR